MAEPKKSRSRKKKFADEGQPLAPEELSSARFINRELSWLEFNQRVLQLAQDLRNPLLERLRFLSIAASNIDEFFMKRVGRLKSKIFAGFEAPTVDGMTSSQQLLAIRQKVTALTQGQADCYTRLLVPSLLQSGIHLLTWGELSNEEQSYARNYFRQNVLAALTPLAVDPGHPFPFISNLSTSFGMSIRHPERDEGLFARVKIPKNIPQWLVVSPLGGSIWSSESGLSDPPAGPYRLLPLHELIRHNLEQVFPGMVIGDVMLFRVTRSAEIEKDNEEAEDIMELMEQEVHQRKFARVVRLETGPQPVQWMLRFLIDELEVLEQDVYEMPLEQVFSSLMPLCDLNLPSLKYRPWIPQTPAVFADEDANIFSIIRNQDVVVHHPYESFVSSVERFVRAAVEDPRVLAIKMTIYRTGDKSPFMPLLIQAARAGKQIVCVVELTASFDEERNIYWAQALEQVGAHVVYGMVGLKTHSKAILVVRQETDGLRCYAHIGTGNYHTTTATTYTDVGLFTADGEIVEDLVDLFHYLTGRSLKSDYRKLLVAPINMREKFLSLIERERENASKGLPSRIIAKINGFDEHTFAKALYRASQDGVKIDLIVRGACTLRPGVPGLSENIRVISVVGRLLEHSRIFYFRNGSDTDLGGDFYIGSADWMYRNLYARVEVATPIREISQRKRIWEILQVLLADRRLAWQLNSDGSYRRLEEATAGEPLLGAHEILMNFARQPAFSKSGGPTGDGA
jgi:polyphosphate kinase